MTAPADLVRNYRTALLRYLPRRDEAALHTGYQVGRNALTSGLSLLEVGRVHQEILVELLGQTRAEDLREVAAAASEFFLEVLATYDMTHRALLGAEALVDPATVKDRDPDPS